MPNLNMAPITIKLYGPDNEPTKTFERTIIPWGVLKKAIHMSNAIENPEEASEQDMDAIAELVVEVFGEQFTIEELNKGADVSETLAVIQAIVNRATALVQQNPTGPSLTPATGKRQKKK